MSSSGNHDRKDRQRYRDRYLIWVLGGDRPLRNDQDRAIIRAMARGLRTGDGGTHVPDRQ